jgi:hypothetical protein
MAAYTRKRLEVEGLEDRCVPAGNVFVNVTDGGDLVIRGDDQANSIRIARGTGAGQYVITAEDVGGAATTINGGSGPLTVNGVRDDVRIKLRGGDDTVVLDHVFVPGELKIDTGTGNDTVRLLNVSASDEVEIETRRGNDVVEISGGFFNRQVEIELGKGDDTLAVQNAHFRRDFEADGGSGFDRFLAQNANNTFEDDLDLDDFEASGAFVSFGGDEEGMI